MKESLDKVLDFLQKDRSRKHEKVLYKPDKKRSILGFIWAVIFFLMMFGFCIVKFSLGTILLLGVSIGILIFYGVNVFTKEGFWIQKYVDKRIVEQLDEINEIERKEQE